MGLQFTTGEPGLLRVTFDGDTWDFTDDDFTVEEMIWIEEVSGLSSPQWLNAVLERRAKAVQVLLCYLQGRKVNPDKIQFRNGDVLMELVEKPKGPKAVGGSSETKRSRAS